MGIYLSGRLGSPALHGVASILIGVALAATAPVLGRESPCPDYQAVQRCSGGLTMADPALQAGLLELRGGPITRYLAVGCGSVFTS